MEPVDPAPGLGAHPERHVAAVLGPVTVLSDTGPVAPRGPRAAALVAALALAAPRAVPVPALIDTLWAEDLPANPRAALQNLVSRLRSLSPGAVRSTSAGYVLGGPSDLGRAHEIAAEARELLATLPSAPAAARPADAPPDGALPDGALPDGALPDGVLPDVAPPDGATTDVPGAPGAAVDAAALLDAALASWRGDPGAELAEATPDLAAELRHTAGRLRAELTALRRQAAVAARDHATAAALASDALATDPLDEDAARDAMTALAASGRPQEAERVFGRLRHALVAELGTEPAPDLVALHARIAAQAETGPATARPARGLRAAATPLLGRDDDVRAVLDELTRHRVVTVLGAGGLGKTRLAQEVARTVAEDEVAAGPLGGLSAAVAELAGVRSDDDVILAVANALGVSSVAGSTRLGDRLLAGDLHDRIVERVRTARTLLVLDNCEHVPVGAARWADLLLSAAPGLRILATSRAPLQVAAEQVYPLAPLAAASGAGVRGPAVELFRQRALAARPGARLPDDVVARLCDRLDGLPLAIELAAARVRTLSVEEIERHLGARFELLRGGDRTAPDRHRTLEAVIEWSWNLLEPSQRALWRRVAVLPDGLSAQAAATLGRLGAGTDPTGDVPLDVLDDIDGLVLQSLLAVEEDGSAPVRYRMLETVREFGLLRLAEAGEDDAVRDALLAWGRAVAAFCTSRLLGPEQVAAVDLLRREHENLLFVIRVAVRAGRPDVVVHGFVALGGAWTLRGAEDRAADLAPAVVEAVTGWPVPAAEADVTALALAYAAATTAFSRTGANLRALARLRRVLRDHGDAVGPRTRAVASMLLAREPGAVLALRDSPDPLIAFLAHLVASQEAENGGRLDEALAGAERAYHLSEGIGDVASRAGAALFMATTAFGAGDTATAERWSPVARAGLTTIGADDALRQLDWVDLGTAIAAGDLAEAERICRRVERAGDGDRTGRGGDESRAVVLAGRAEILWARGDVAGCLDLYEQATGMFADLSGTSHAAAGSGDEPSPTAPWAVIVGSAWVVRLADAGRLARAGQVADLVRRRAMVLYREWMRQTPDHPVLGTACLAVGAVLVADGSGGDAAAGLELLALAERMGSRQDFKALWREPLAAAAADRHGEAALAAARARVAAVPREDLAEHALTTLEAVPVPLPDRQALRR
ncbi:AfsR/SARP family transcriptional regulator [Promicromonospora sp. NPDC052451]|uniref:AfsR/SARP family transcriptional regulator n=1 Tax=Promicromonospora sp. NPDC052451 TaxID=3364407 RepID=UPI0037C8154B